MRILFLSSVLPHARVVGGPIIIYNRIRLLVERGHEVGLACFFRDEGQPSSADLEPLLLEMERLPVPRPRGALLGLAENPFAPVPAQFRQLRSDRMSRLVGAMVERSRYDVVIAEYSVMGQYLHGNPYLSAVRRVVSCHECCTVAALKALKMRRHSPRALARLMALRGLQQYEFDIYRDADHVLVLTPQEEHNLLGYAPDLKISVVPYGVDVDYFQPGAPSDEESLVYTGVYRHETNRDAVMWFASEVWPLLKSKHPALKFYVVGPLPSPAMRELGRRDPRIVVTGEVADVREYLRRARLFVCPVRMGSGFRGKILQAMAAGVPVVSTTLGAEGFRARNCENILLADTAHGMAESIEILLGEPDLRVQVAENARRQVVQDYSWKHSVNLLEGVLDRVVSPPH